MSFRVAITNKRVLNLEDGRVTFKYKDSATDQERFCTVSAEEFIRRFLQHVLPDRFVKVRYYGLLSPGNRDLLSRARRLLKARNDCRHSDQPDEVEAATDPLRCPSCGSEMARVERIKPRRKQPP